MNESICRRGLFFAVSGLALMVYVLTLPPTVTLTQASMFAVAADHLGVGKHPGYPVWSLTAHLFVKVFGFFSYRGYPNPARAVALVSAIWGAIGCGLLSLLVYDTARDGSESRRSPWVYAVPAFSASLLFGFSHAMWYHTVHAETHSLTVMFFIGTLLVFQQWRKTQKRTGLWLIALLMGINIAVSPLLLILLPLFLLLFILQSRNDHLIRIIVHGAGCLLLTILAFSVPYILLIAFSSHDAPMMADLTTWQGIRHMLMRGQYEQISIRGHWRPAVLFDIYKYWARICIHEYTIPIAVLGIFPLVFIRRMSRRQKRWAALMALMLCISFFVVLYVAFPRFDAQTTLAYKPLMLPALAVMAVWIGWGMALVLQVLYGRKIGIV